jgi:signal peptidase I
MKDASSVLVAAAVVLCARSSLADHYRVPSGSMLPTVQLEDHVFVDKLAYGVHVPLVGKYAVRYGAPSRGDVVVLDSPEDGSVLLKRIVAVPGDVVRVEDGALELNGERVPVARGTSGLVEKLGAGNHPLDLDDGGGPDFGPVTIPADRYLVLGDHRGNSKDGRFFGLVRGDAVIGRAAAVILRDGKPTWIAL